MTIASLSIAQALFRPLRRDRRRLAPLDIRGRYMGAWTLVWQGGHGSLGPIFGGLLLARLGPHVTYGAIVVMGLAGACLYPTLRAARSAAVAAARL